MTRSPTSICQNYALQIENLPKEAIVETNALFTYNDVSPIYAGKMPEDIRALTMPHIKNHERIYEAAIKKDRKLVYQAFKEEQYNKLATHIRQHVDMDKVYQILASHD